MTDWPGFLPPPPRTVREVFPHTAHRHPSPGRMRGAVVDASDERAQAEVALLANEPAAVRERTLEAVALADEPAQPLDRVAVELVELGRRVAATKVAAPAGQEPVQAGHDVL